MNNLKDFEKSINYTFKNIALLQTALTHSSASSSDNYERMEFLGDSLLSIIVAEHLFLSTTKKVGVMSVMRSNLVSTDALSKIVLANGWDKYITVGQSVAATHNIAKNILADIFESITAAIYLDSNFENAKQFVTTYVLSGVDECVGMDYKTKLQEKLAKINPDFELKYEVLASSGPSHNMQFTIGLKYNGELVSSAEGSSKKNAEQLCAKLFLEQLKK